MPVTTAIVLPGLTHLHTAQRSHALTGSMTRRALAETLSRECVVVVQCKSSEVAVYGGVFLGIGNGFACQIELVMSAAMVSCGAKLLLCQKRYTVQKQIKTNSSIGTSSNISFFFLSHCHMSMSMGSVSLPPS